jgi:hypothetical protein
MALVTNQTGWPPTSSSSPPAPTRLPVTPTSRPPPPTPSPSTSKFLRPEKGLVASGSLLQTTGAQRRQPSKTPAHGSEARAEVQALVSSSLKGLRLSVTPTSPGGTGTAFIWGLSWCGCAWFNSMGPFFKCN